MRPPRLATWLLHATLGEEHEAFVGDLIEEYPARVHQDGALRARLWFWREAIGALRHLGASPREHRMPLSHATAGASRVSSFLADMRHAVRLARRSPGFTALCVLTLGLSIGATTAIFSVVNPVLLRSLPYPDADRLVMVWERDADGAPSNTTFATYSDLVARARSIQRAAALGGWQPTLTEPGNAERVQGARVSWTYFRVLGVRPAIGRDFVEAEDNRSAELAVILSHGLWMRRYGGDRSIVGRAIPIDGARHNVVGVLPPSFDNVLSPNAQIWRVLRYETSSPSACRTCRHLRMVARLRPEVTREQAAAELDRLSGVLIREHPRDYPAAGVHVVRLQDQVTRSLRPVLFAVLGATALVLLIAIANVTSLQLARAMRREGEFAVRSALGAGRGRLVQQLLAEGLLVATLGGVAGVLVAIGALPALLARLPQELPRLAAVRVDVTALGVAATITLVIGILIGLTPAWRGGRPSVFDTLRGGTRVAGFPRHVARAGLVVAEIALALMLLAGAGLLSRSLLGLLAVDTGFQPANLLTLGVQSTGNRYDSAAKVFAYHDRVRGAVLAVPGVIGVGLTSQLPLGGNMDTYGIRAKDKPLARPELAPSADRYTVSHDFMQTMRIPLLRGRYFTPVDNRDSTPPVVIVSAALAAKIWPGEAAVGKQIQLGNPDSPWREVVGVAANVRHSGLDATVTQQVYMPSRQWQYPDFWVTLVVRTQGDPASLAAAVRRAVRSIDPDQPITSVATMDQVIATSTAQRRLALLLFAAFAGVALLLAAAGIYGVMAGSVAERTREIGVRAALGAAPVDILRMVLLQGARLAAVGLAIGIAGALGFGRVLETLLYGIEPADPFTLGGVSVILAAIAGAACLVPARRALEVDPVTALRAE